MNDASEAYFPPEWAAQSAVLLAWPYPQGDFNRWQEAAEATYALIAAAICQRQGLIVACRDGVHRRQIESRLSGQGANLANIAWAEIPYNDVWVRDTAPLSIETPAGPRLLNFRFNGWGGKYEHGDDARLAENLHRTGVLGDAPLVAVDFVLEGGSLETDGAGTLLTTARCLLNPNRNPSFAQADIEAQLKASFGLKRMLWLWHGHAEGDDTDAHIDTLARFCDARTIAYTAADNPQDPLYPDLQAMEAELREFRTSQGEAYRLVALPIPQPIYSEESERLPATYANFLIINHALLVPVYGDPNDALALARLQSCFPEREMIPIPATPLIRQYGSIHCMAMQFPASIHTRPGP
jgi:agmatine/peptidylarginine deiminase